MSAQLQPTKALSISKSLVIAVVTIANGQGTSAVINTAGLSLVGIQLPAAFTGTAITFLASLDGTTFQEVYTTTSDTALSYTVAQGHYIAIDPAPFQGIPFLKLVSGSNEGADRAFSVALKGL